MSLARRFPARRVYAIYYKITTMSQPILQAETAQTIECPCTLARAGPLSDDFPPPPLVGGARSLFFLFFFFFFFNRVGRKQSYCSEFSANQKSTKKHSGLLSFRCLDDYRMILSPLSRSDVALRRTVRAVCQSTCDVRTP